jgi:hypothetical protein
VSSRTLFSTKSKKKKIKLIKNAYVTSMGVRNSLHSGPDVYGLSHEVKRNSSDEQSQIESLKQIAVKNKSIYAKMKVQRSENMFSPESKYNRKNSSKKISTRMSQSLNKAKEKLTSKLVKEQERCSVSGSVSGSMTSSHMFNF